MNKIMQFFLKEKFLEVVLIFATLLLLFSVYFKLGYENINVDQFLWYQRTENFFTAISNKDFASTYQQYHPGVTLMYLIGLGQLSYKMFTGDASVYSDVTYQNFGEYNFHTKLYVVTFCILIIFLSAHLVHKITKSKVSSLLFLVLLLFESYYVGVLRNLHMDGILSVLLFSSVLSYYLACRDKSVRYFILSGILSGLSFLTKSTSFFTILYCGIIFLLFFIKFKSGDEKRWLVKMTCLWVLTFLTLFFLLFPAMWINPISTVKKIVYDGVIETGVSGSFNHYVNNKMTDDPGVAFYPKVLKFRVTPIMQFLLLFFAFHTLYVYVSRKKYAKPWGVVLLSSLFIFIYLTVFMAVKKKTDRYMAPIYPFLALLGSYSLYILKDFISRKKILTVSYYTFIVLSISYYVWNTVTISPYFMAYYNHLWGGIDKARYEIYLNQGGIGVFEIASYLDSMTLPPNPKIAASNERELQKVLRYNISAPEPYKRKEYDIVIVPLQMDSIYKKGRKTVKVFKIQGQNYWKVFSSL